MPIETSKKRILIVEDEKISKLVLKKQLEHIFKDSAIIEEAENGLEAARMVFNNKPDLIFTDIMMPVMDGVSLIRIVNETHLDTIPIVVISAFTDCLKIEYENVYRIVKPTDINNLKTVVNIIKGKYDV